MDKKILLIAYQFCPKGQIGTRRWSKFAKYLTRQGYTVHVLCARYPYRDEVNWCHDVEGNPKIVIHAISARYPTYVLRPVRNFWIKVFDRILTRTLYYFDKSQWWGAVMIPTAVKLLTQESIEKVIVTGPPFSPFYQSVKIKNKLPHISLILDFRDPWSPIIGKKSLLDQLRFRVGIKWESLALNTANKVLFTTHDLREKYAELYPLLKSKFEVLYNGYDEDDFLHLPEPSSPKPFSLVYTGSVTGSRSLGLAYLIRAIADLKDDFIREHFHLDIYGYSYNPPSFQEPHLQELSDKLISYKGVVSQAKVFAVLQEYEFCLSLNAPEHAGLIGAKTFDYMGLNKKIFLISPPGELSDILNQSEQYVATYATASIQAALKQMKIDHLEEKESANKKGYQDFIYPKLTSELITYLK